MPKTNYRIRRIAAAGALLLSLVPLGACDRTREQLLAAETPDIINPSTVTSPEAADALRIGALARVRNITAGGEGAWLLGGLLTDEWKSSDTFSQRNETDQRTVQESNANIAGFYVTLHQTRNTAREAIDALAQYKPTPAWGIGQMWWSIGFAELTLGETFCNGIPLGDASTGVVILSKPYTTAEVFAIAVAHMDTALTFLAATDAATTAVRNTVLITKARLLVDLGQHAAAAALVPAATIPTTFANTVVTFSLTSGDNQIWSLNNSAKRWTVGDSFDVSGRIANAIPFASAGDPRLKVTGTTTGTSAAGRGFDGSTNLITQAIWGRSDASNLVSGIDARLIEAEARLKASDIAGTITILNALRGSPQVLGPLLTTPVMANLATPATLVDAENLFFREKAYWQFGRGFRLGDLRRMVRQYNRADNAVFPVGVFFKTGTPYGTDVNLPVTTGEYNNPDFHGCIDRKA